MLVWIGRSTGDTPVEDFAERAFKAWGVGTRTRDDGAVLFILADDRKVRIEVGYGLEDRVPDLVASRIIREAIAPRLQAGDRDGAVTAGVDALLAAIDRQGPTAPATGRPAAHPLSLGQKILFGLLGLFILWFLVTHPVLAYYLLVNILSSSGGGGSRGGSGWGGGGGGFSGGGGRSGGGGATGSW